MSSLAAIWIHPVKSLQPVSVSTCKILSGALEHDREFTLFDSADKFVNGKRNPKIHTLKASFDWASMSLTMQSTVSNTKIDVHLPDQHNLLELWLSKVLDIPITVKQNSNGGFPDDLKAPGPTIISSATIDRVTSWFPPLEVSEIRTRFRANLELADVPAFWEDRLFDTIEKNVRFRIGDVVFEGTNPCQRCIVPTRDTHSGDQYPEFANIFRSRRESELPPWANRDRFNHFYRLAVNTMLAKSENGKALHVGDTVEIL